MEMNCNDNFVFLFEQLSLSSKMLKEQQEQLDSIVRCIEHLKVLEKNKHQAFVEMIDRLEKLENN